MRYSVSFAVPWVHGLQRARNFPGRTVDTDRNRTDKMEVAAAYRSACASVGLPGLMAKSAPVRVEIRARRPLPKTRPLRVESEPDVVKPDVDNVIKLILDGLNGVAYVDDVQVSEVSCARLPRRRGVTPMTEVTVSWESPDDVG